MNVCGKLQIPPPCPFPRPRSWLVSTLDAVKLLIKIHNSVMPGGDQDSSDESAFCLKVRHASIPVNISYCIMFASTSRSGRSQAAPSPPCSVCGPAAGGSPALSTQPNTSR